MTYMYNKPLVTINFLPRLGVRAVLGDYLKSKV